MAFYGALGIMAIRKVPRLPAALLIVAAVLLVAGIAVSRVALGAHSPEEVCLGLAVGSSMLIIFAVHYLNSPVPRVDFLFLVALPVVAIPALIGYHVDAEPWLHRGSTFLASFRHVCG